MANDNKKSSKTAAAAGGIMAGIFGSNILRNIGSAIFGEVASKASEEIMKIAKGGKGFNDEALYNMVAIAELTPAQYEDLQKFALQLYHDDKKDHTEHLVQFILFIATGAQAEEVKEDKPSTDKDAKKDEKPKDAKPKKSRDTKTGGEFLKKLLAKQTHEERLDLCRANHVFDVPSEGYIRIAKKIAIPIKKYYGDNSADVKNLSENWLAKAKQKFEDSKK